MAQLVLGLGSSHTAQLQIPWNSWHLGGEKDMVDPRFDYPGLLNKARPGLELEVTPAKFRERYETCRQGMTTITEALKRIAPDVIVILGDDQQEQFHDDNMPMLCIYHGESLPVAQRRRRQANGSAGQPRSDVENMSPQRRWLSAQQLVDMAPEYPGERDLANHLLRFLVREEFDVARSNKLKADVGLGHAFTYLYQLGLECDIPVVPFMVNTYHPPNQPTPKRCYALGRALRWAIEAWDPSKRVAILASGGLSHQVIDEEVDEMTVEGLKEKNPEILFRLPEERLVVGTSEIRNWVIAAGATEAMDLGYFEYIPCYRSLAGTGCAMGFAIWE